MNLSIAIFILFSIVSIVNSDDLKCSLYPEYRMGINYLNKALFFKCKQIKSTELQTHYNRFFQLKDREVSSNLHLEQVDFGTEQSKEVKLANGWFTIDLKLVALIFKLTNFNQIEGNAFNSYHFERLFYLELTAVPIEVIAGDTFNGLNRLGILHMQGTKVHRFDGKPLVPVPNLQFFGMFSCIDEEINIDNLFGPFELKKLNHLWISNCNLRRCITKSTFSGLVNVTDLQLNGNVIEEIGPNSFDKVLEKSKLLTLIDNNLKTIPMNLFKTQQIMRIAISSNPWTCSCDADQIQQFVDSSPNVKFEGNTCITQDLTCYPMSTESKETEEPPKDDTKPYVDFLTVNCEENQNNNLNFHTAASENLPSFYYDGEQIFVDASDHPPVFDLIEFEETGTDGKKPVLNCMAHRKGDARRVDITSKLSTNQMFRFCLVEEDADLISHCVAIFFHSKVIDSDLPWIEDLILMIISLFISSVFGLGIGMLIAFAMTRKFPNLIGKIE